MEQAALAFDHDHLVMLIGQDELFGRAADEIGDDAIDRAAAAGHEDAGLARGHEGGVHAGAVQAGGHFDAGDHLAATAIVGDGVDPQAALADALALGHVVLVVLADVDQLHAVLLGGPAELGVVARGIRAGRRRSSSAGRWPPG